MKITGVNKKVEKKVPIKFVDNKQFNCAYCFKRNKKKVVISEEKQKHARNHEITSLKSNICSIKTAFRQ